MEYVSKEAVLAAIDDWLQFAELPDNRFMTAKSAWESAIISVKDKVACMDPNIETSLDITEILFREPRKPIRVRENLMLCPTCRKQLKDGHSYCKKCGQAILRQKGAGQSE